MKIVYLNMLVIVDGSDNRLVFYSNDRICYAFGSDQIFKFDMQNGDGFRNYGRADIHTSSAPNPLEFPSGAYVLSNDKSFNVRVALGGVIDYKFEFESENKSVSETLTKANDYEARIAALEDMVSFFEEKMMEAGII